MKDFNKFAGAGLGALLCFLLLNFASELLFHGDGGHHGEPLGYAVEIAAADVSVPDPVEEEPDWAGMVASADATNGEGIFRRACASCHVVEDGANRTGPHLWGVVGREIGSVASFGNYSNTLANKGGEWDLASLSGFLENPSQWAPGTGMGYGGLRKAQDRVDLIVYLNEADGSPIELVSAQQEDAAAEGTGEEVTEGARHRGHR